MRQLCKVQSAGLKPRKRRERQIEERIKQMEALKKE
jgi:hypothetical protein